MGGRGGGGGGQGGCERRIEVFGKFKKKKNRGELGVGGRWGGIKVDVNAMLGVGGGAGYGGCEGGGVMVHVNREVKFL